MLTVAVALCSSATQRSPLMPKPGGREEAEKHEYAHKDNADREPQPESAVHRSECRVKPKRQICAPSQRPLCLLSGSVTRDDRPYDVGDLGGST